MLKWGKSQGGVVGFSHSGWGLKISDDKLPSYEIPPFDGIGANEYIVDVVHDAVDFISTVDTPAPWELNIWYHTLNCGYRAKISGETDFPCIYGERVGLGRVYVKLADGQLDFDHWCEGIKQGRSYVSDGTQPPDRLSGQRSRRRASRAASSSSTRPATVKVTAQVAAYLDPTISAEARAIHARPLDQKPYWDLERARIGETRKVPVEVVVNGEPVARTEVSADGSIQGVSFDVPIKKSSWVALRIYPSSHTNPVFVIGRRQADPGLEEIGRMVPEVRRPVLVARRSRPSAPPRKTRPRRPTTSPAMPTRRSWRNVLRTEESLAWSRRNGPAQ